MSAAGLKIEHSMFSRAEMDRRYRLAREGMAKAGIDALLVSGEENFQYLAGAAASLALHGSLTRPSIFILPLEREPIIITQGRANLTLGCYVSDIRDYRELLRFPDELVLAALQEVKHARIGAELGQEQRMGMPVGAYLELVAGLPGTQFVDAAEILIRLRMVKSKEEHAFMRRAAEITGRARQRLFGEVRSGMTELDIDRLMRRLILEEGGDRTSFVILQLDRPGSGNAFKYERPVERGTLLAVDAGARVGMYTVDYARMAKLGKATNLEKHTHAAVLDINRKMIEALRPGVRVSDLHAIGARAIEAMGLSPLHPGGLVHGRMGHGQGMLVTEPPSITPKDHTVLEAGMVISTEPGIRSGDVQFLWEDVHVITEDGHEQLTRETDELRELDA